MRSSLLLRRTTLVLFLAYAYINLVELLRPITRLPRGLPGVLEYDSTIAFAVTFFALSALHAILAMGFGSASRLFAISAMVGWMFEEVGVRTGLIFGPYHYSNLLGPKLLSVPILIPLSWFMMVYCCYVLSNLLAGAGPYEIIRGRLQLLLASLIGAALMTGWDVVMDPMMSQAGYWTWDNTLPRDLSNWWGVPMHNFGGWMLTTFTIYTLFRLAESRSAVRPPSPLSRFSASIPLLAYGILFTRYLTEPVPEHRTFATYACYTMGLPLLIATALLLKRPTPTAWR